MKKSLFYTLLFIVFSSFICDSGSDFSELIRQKLHSYETKHWPEKVYVHTDKPYYTLGEDLWFSTYLVNGITHEESDKSSVVHIELINEANAIVASKKLFVDELSTGGHFKIDQDWAPGTYLLRAYTNYMQNETEPVFFHKVLQLISLDEKANYLPVETEEIDQTDPIKLEKPNLQFFPEGGYLVENLTSKVAIKIKNTTYHKSQLPVEIIDSRGMVLSRLNSTEFGLGFFYITPRPDENYFAKLSINGIVYQYPLPKPLAQGYSLGVNFKNDDLLIALNSTNEKGLNQVYLVVHQRGKILFDQVVQSVHKSEVLSIYTGNLKSGVTHLTLFNNEGQPVCERLVFIDHLEGHTGVTVKQNKKEFKSREKVALHLQMQSLGGISQKANVSMTVRNADALPQLPHAQNIKT